MVRIEDLFKFKEHPQSNAYRSITFRWNIIEKIPEFALLEKCEQNPKWHSEGNAFQHTKLVCKHAIKEVLLMSQKEDREHDVYNIAMRSDEFETCYLEPSLFNVALTLLTAALFHDIGKGVTTFKGKDGNWHAYNHENEGEKITRLLLWNERLKFREDVCALVKYHMLPLSIFERKDYLEEIIRVSYNIPSWKLLLMLKRSDLEGSLQKDEILKQRDRIMLDEIESITKEIGCYESKKIKSTFFKNRVSDSQKYLDNQYKKPLNIIVMIGIPGAGKDTFINEKLIQDKKSDIESISVVNIDRVENHNNTINVLRKEDVAVISRDAIRYELGYCKEGKKVVLDRKKEEKVSDEFKNRLYDAASEGKTIILNNVNLKKEYRAEFARLLSNYDLHITYIYVEASDFQKNVERREGQIDAETLKNIIRKFEWPEHDEYDEFYYERT